MSVVIITGASGFVGANVARFFAARGDDVHLLLRAQSRAWRLENFTAYTPHYVDLSDDTELADLFSRLAPRYVLHLAAYGAYESQADVRQAVITNVESSIKLMECARQAGVERFINTGSSSEYGYKDHAPAEDEVAEPNSLYAVTKLTATQYGQFIARRHGFHVTTLRLYSVYGPFEEPTRLLPRIIVRAREGSYPPLVSPTIARDYVHVDDVVKAYACVLAADILPGRVYNIGTGVQTSLAEVVNAAAEMFTIREAPNWGTMPERRWDTNVWVSDSKRAAAEIGWRSQLPFRDGFKEAARWLVDDQQRFRFYESYDALPR